MLDVFLYGTKHRNQFKIQNFSSKHTDLETLNMYYVCIYVNWGVLGIFPGTYVGRGVGGYHGNSTGSTSAVCVLGWQVHAAVPVLVPVGWTRGGWSWW